MPEYIKIDHIDQLLSLNTERQAAFREEVKKYLKEHPLTHIREEWGRFQNLPDLSQKEIEDLITWILKEMSLEQKVNQMSADYSPGMIQYVMDRYNCEPYYAGEDRELNIPGIKFTDGPTGVVLGYHSTAFPVSMARAATFDRDLERRIGNAIGMEARSGGANYFAGVCINLLRHPGWGRAQETYGEDPCLLGAMGSALTEGVQEHVMACVKHFAANSIENARFKVSVEMDERTLREVYLPHFKDCIDAGAASVMSAYNRVRGEWCGHNRYLLTNILKKEWGFDGFVMSDFIFGIRGTVDPAKAGMDVEMNATQFYGKRLEEAVCSGEVEEAQVDDSVRRILRQKIRFASQGDPSLYGKEKMACPEHTQLSLEAARKSMVLLKNDNILPFKRDKTQKILVAGDLAKVGAIGDSKGSSAVFPPYTVTALEGIGKIAGKDVQVDFVRGVVEDEVRQRGKDYDAVVVFVGLTHLDEGEYFPSSVDFAVGGDRTDLRLNLKDQSLIAAAAEGNPATVVVLQGGSAIQVEPWVHSVPALLMQWYAGMEGGTALGEILWGEINPSGKLPVTIHAKKQQLPYFGLDLTTIEYDMFHGYFEVDRKHTAVSYPFGFGLSYTDYEYSDLSVSYDGNAIAAEVSVANTGSVGGEEIVQMYIGYEGSSVIRHEKDLRAFGRVSLDAGEQKKVTLRVKKEKLAYYDEEKKTWIIEKIPYLVFVGPSSSKKDLLKQTMTLESPC